MKKILLLCAALLALSASAAFAQGGVNLSWTDCGTFGAENRTSACTSNTGSAGILVGSFISPIALPQYLGGSAVMDLQADSPSLPAWWNVFNSTSCRPTGVSPSFDFTANVNCVDFFAGQASGGITAYQTPFAQTGSGDAVGLNRARMKVTMAIPSGLVGATPLEAGVETYMYKVSISNTKTTGTGSCAGCSIPVCIVLNQVVLEQPAAAQLNVTLTNPADRAFVKWQGGGTVNCPGATPTSNATWGSVKSLYR